MRQLLLFGRILLLLILVIAESRFGEGAKNGKKTSHRQCSTMSQLETYLLSGSGSNDVYTAASSIIDRMVVLRDFRSLTQSLSKPRLLLSTVGEPLHATSASSASTSTMEFVSRKLRYLTSASATSPTSSAIRTLSFVVSYSKPDSSEHIVFAHGMPINSCVCGTVTTTLVNSCFLYTVLAETGDTISFQKQLFESQDSCSGLVSKSETFQTKTVAEESTTSFCGDDLILRTKVSIDAVGSKIASFPQGFVKRFYFADANCLTNNYAEYSFASFLPCKDFPCGSEQLRGLGINSFEIMSFNDACEDLKYSNLVFDNVGTCYDYLNSDDDAFMVDDDGASYYYFDDDGTTGTTASKKQTKRLLQNGKHGYPFVSRTIIYSPSSSTDVVVSETMFTLLIVCIFIALLCGCGCGGILYYCLLTRKP